MNILDFLIGLTLMNAMPHFILGIWKGKMLSGFGVGNTQNILWGIFNFLLSHSLFIYAHTIKGYLNHEMYLGANAVLLTFFGTSYFWHRFYQHKN